MTCPNCVKESARRIWLGLSALLEITADKDRTIRSAGPTALCGLQFLYVVRYTRWGFDPLVHEVAATAGPMPQ